MMYGPAELVARRCRPTVKLEQLLAEVGVDLVVAFSRPSTT
jgi:hypothetical protein